MKIQASDFENEVLKSEIPVLVDFYATWCGPCKMMTPLVEKIESEMEGKIKVCQIDTDEAMDLAREYNIMSIPTFMVFKGGEVVATAIGMQDKEEMMNLINNI